MLHGAQSLSVHRSLARLLRDTTLVPFPRAMIMSRRYDVAKSLVLSERAGIPASGSDRALAPSSTISSWFDKLSARSSRSIHTQGARRWTRRCTRAGTGGLSPTALFSLDTLGRIRPTPRDLVTKEWEARQAMGLTHRLPNNGYRTFGHCQDLIETSATKQIPHDCCKSCILAGYGDESKATDESWAVSEHAATCDVYDRRLVVQDSIFHDRTSTQHPA